MGNCNIQNSCSVNNRSREDLLDLITKVSFAMDDTRLFLDTHPDCVEAMDFFRKMMHIRHDLIEEYTERYGALVSYDMWDNDKWTWNDCNIPWLLNKKGGF